MKRIRDDASTHGTGSAMELALTPSGRNGSEDKYPPTPNQQEESGAENDIRKNPTGDSWERRNRITRGN